MTPKANFTLLHDLVMIYAVPKAAKTESGLIIPESTDSAAPSEGMVVAVGPGKFNVRGDLIPVPVEAGDRVIFLKNQGREIKQGADTFIILPVADVLCKIERETASKPPTR